ncbi:MAG TPA: proline dehydrogenase family protein [Thermoanaerobaculia bacterium]|jgi:proline dehydrogenase
MASTFSRLVVATLPAVPKFIVGRVAAPYVAGETLDDAVATIRELNAEGAMATLDLLGEEVRDRARARAATEEYLRILDRIRADGLDSNVSVKLSQLGQQLDEGFCLENVTEVVAAADGHDNFVRLDMEDHTTTASTLGIYRALCERFGGRRVGVVFQSYMRRTLQDVAELPAADANVRLCKGIYIEPQAVAWKGYETVRLNFLAALEKLLTRGVYVGVATHDEYLICAAVAMLDRLGVPRERYEFQMLLGVEPRLRKILIAAGHRLRVYVPYGREWYQYSVRRLRENPEVALHVMRAMFRR